MSLPSGVWGDHRQKGSQSLYLHLLAPAGADGCAVCGFKSDERDTGGSAMAFSGYVVIYAWPLIQARYYIYISLFFFFSVFILFISLMITLLPMIFLAI